MPLLESNRITYKPLEYEWAYKAFLKQHQSHWMPQEVSMADDIKDWRSVLTQKERNLLSYIFKFFTQADIEVHKCYMMEYTKIFRAPEVSLMLTAFCSMETIHIVAYAFLLDSLGIDESEFSTFLDIGEMRAKYDFLQSFKCDNIHNTARTLAIFGAFTEGLMLFSSFAILLNPQRFGKMKGMGQIVAWSARDETLHTMSMIELYHTLVSEYGNHINLPLLQDEIVSHCESVVKLEDDFLDLVYSMGDVEGLGKDEVKLYIRYVANYRLNQLKINKILYPEARHNPLPWLDEILNGQEFANFFENKSTEYAKASMSGEWQDAFNE